MSNRPERSGCLIAEAPFGERRKRSACYSAPARRHPTVTRTRSSFNRPYLPCVPLLSGEPRGSSLETAAGHAGNASHHGPLAKSHLRPRRSPRWRLARLDARQCEVAASAFGSRAVCRSALSDRPSRTLRSVVDWFPKPPRRPCRSCREFHDRPAGLAPPGPAWPHHAPPCAARLPACRPCCCQVADLARLALFLLQSGASIKRHTITDVSRDPRRENVARPVRPL